MPNNPLTPAELQAYSINPTGIPQMPAGYFLASPVSGTGPFAYRLFDASYISLGIINPNRLGTGSTGLGTSYLADDGTWKPISGITPPTPTLAQVTTAGNTTTNAITVGNTTTNNLTIDGTGSILVTQTAYNNSARIGTIGGYDFLYGAFRGLFVGNNTNMGRWGITTASATNLHIWQQANNAIIFATNNTEAMRIASTNNVLIGTTTDAGYKLDVNGTGRVVGPTFRIGDASKYFEVYTDGFGYKQLRLFSAGNFETTLVSTSGGGLAGYNSGVFAWAFSASKLQIRTVSSEGLSGYQPLSFNSNLYPTNTTTPAYDFNVYTGSGSGITVKRLQMFNGESGKIVLQETGGNVLIGTTTDSGYKLDVNGTSRFTQAVVVNAGGVKTESGTITAQTGVNSGRMMMFNLRNTGGGYQSAVGTSLAIAFTNRETGAVWSDDVIENIVHSNTAGAVTTGYNFYTHNNQVYNASPFLAMSINGLNVGIGTSTPTDKLHIVDNTNGNKFARISAGGTDASAAWVAQNDQVDNIVYRVFGSAVTGSQMGQALARSASLIANLGGTGKFLIGSYSATDLIFGTSDQARMRLVDSTGNFLIGTMTDSGHKLSVSGTAKIGSDLTLDAGLIIDSTDITNAWVAYTPIWSSDGGTQPNLADGTITGFYKKIGKTVFVRVKLNFGLTTTGGTGSWLFSLPVNAASSDGIQFPCSMLDNGFAWYQGTVNGTYSGFTDKSAIITQSAGGANSAQSVTGSFPFAWGNADSLQFNGSYECI